MLAAIGRTRAGSSRQTVATFAGGTATFYHGRIGQTGWLGTVPALDCLSGRYRRRGGGTRMAARATWKGYLKVSLVNIPIRVFPATDSAASVSFNQLHGECQTRIQQKKWCPKCEREVPNAELVKGYEFEKGRYVVVSEEDIEKVRPASTRVIDLQQFAERDELDPDLLRAALLPGAGHAGRGRRLRGHPRGHGRQGRHRQGRALRPRIPGRSRGAREGPGDVHAAPGRRDPRHGRGRRSTTSCPRSRRPPRCSSRGR